MEQFQSINGYSNQFFGRGGENDGNEHVFQKTSFSCTLLDMAARVLTKYRISRYPAEIARYKMLQQQPNTLNHLRLDSFLLLLHLICESFRYKTLESGADLRSIDGLSNLQYTVIKTTNEKLFTHILVTYNETSIRASVTHIKKKKKKKKKKNQRKNPIF